MILAIRPHGSELFVTRKVAFCAAYPYNKLNFLAFFINRYGVEAVLFVGHFPGNHVIVDDSDHWLHYISG